MGHLLILRTHQLSINANMIFLHFFHIMSSMAISSVESKKGIIADQRCSVENQKGAIAIDFGQR